MATNEILPFASTDTGTNLLTQSEYTADAQRTTGNQPGIARSKLVNKAMRQASLLSAGVAQFMANKQTNNITDGLTKDQIAEYMVTAVQQSVFPAGTTMLFAQPTAPTGWTQVTADSCNNRMIRVVNTTGGGFGGTNSPIINNVVPSHTHNYTTGGQSAGHTHGVSATTTGVSNDHSHFWEANTGWAGEHNHGVNDPGHSHPVPNGGYNGSGPGWSATDTYTRTMNTFGATTGIWLNNSGSHTHYVSGTSAGASSNHTHSFSTTSGATSNDHTHSGTTDNGSSQTNWQPRYLDIIVCTKA